MWFWSLLVVVSVLCGVAAIGFALSGIAVVLFAIAGGLALVVVGKAALLLTNRSKSDRVPRDAAAAQPASGRRHRRTSQESSRIS